MPIWIDWNDYIGIILKFMIIAMPFIVQGCPFTDYEQSLLSKKYQLEITSVEIINSSQSFAFWSFCIPSWDVDSYPQIEQRLFYDYRNQQLLFLMKSEDDQSLIMFMYVDFTAGNQKGVIHRLHITTGDLENIYEYAFDSKIYEGTWILSMITIQQQQIIFQTSESADYYEIQNEMPQSNKITFIIGGTGIVHQQYQLGIFRGRLSTLIKYNDQLNQNFEWVQQNCYVPVLLQGEQTIYLIEDIQIFEGNNQIIKEIDQVGKKFYFSGWVKYDFTEASFTTTYLLLRLTIFKNYGDELRLGDELAKITVNLDISQPKNCGYDVISHLYSTPLLGSVNQNQQERLTFRDDGQYYYQQLQQWHMVQFTYEQHNGPTVSFNFVSSNNIIIEKFPDENAQGLFINTRYYAIIGSDRTTLKKLRGQLANLIFRFNYQSNTQINLSCHYTCNTCNGPLLTNCLKCYGQQNRIYSEDLKTCSCQQGYIEELGECKSFTEIYPLISFLNVIIHQNMYICEPGYFLLPTIQQCIKCPQQNQVHILCADCLINPSTWFLKPVCKMDYIVDGESGKPAYRLQERLSIYYDVYFIDFTSNLVLIGGAENYCNTEYDYPNCFKIEEQTHLFQPFYIFCKQDHYQQNKKCLQSIQNCIKSDYESYNCLQCDVGYYLFENRCLLCSNFCMKCNINNGILECLQCPDGYEIQGGDCLKCGLNCKTCKLQQIKDSNFKIMQCLKCIHDQKYYISLNGEDCFENPIKNCLYAFEVSRYQKKINSLDYQFTPYFDNTYVICGQCQQQYAFNEETNLCQLQKSSDCYYSYLSAITQFEEVCLFGPKIKSYRDPVSFITESSCLNYNCHICIIGQINIKVSYLCLECNNGYYAEILTGLCVPCPQTLKCQVCYQQNKISKDKWKNQVRAYYRQVIDDDLQSHSFIDYGLSQNPNDYEIICQFCLQGYEIHNDKCIQVCSDTCLKCKIINDENICIECPSIQGKRSLSLHNNQCIQCSRNCVFCRQREEDEIKLINPIFNNQEFNYYSNQCLQRQKGYFDKDLKMYVDCPFWDCMKEIQINLYLHCSQEQYYQQIQSLEREEDVRSYKQSNLLLDDLFSTSSFQEFETPEFYQMANEQVIKSIIIRIFSFESQTCIIYNNKSIKQKFSQNIFSAINIQLELYGNGNTVFLYDKIISIVNFKKVHIEGIILSPLSVHNLKQLFFHSVFEQTVQLMDIRYESNLIQDQSQILIWNSTNIHIDTFFTQNLNLTDIFAFIIIEQIKMVQTIHISNIKIIDCYFKSLSVFYLNTKSSDTLYFLESNFSSTFEISQLINSTSGQLIVQNIIIKNSLIIDVINLIGGKLLESIQVNQFQMYKNRLINSTIFGLKTFFYITSFIFTENNIYNGSSIFNNSNYSTRNLYFNQLKFSLNLNDKNSKFIQIKNNQIVNQYLFFNGLTLYLNSLDIKSTQPLFDKQDESLIFLEAQSIQINNLIITRSFGIKDIVIQKGLQLTLNQVKILQDKQYFIQGLHQYFDCIQKNIESKQYFTSIYLYNIQFISLQQIIIEQVSIINYPIINIQSSIEMITISKEIYASELNFQNNLLLITDQLKQSSILQLTSQSEYQITIINSVMEKNLMHYYQQNDLINNALLLNFDCSHCTLKLSNITIKSNIVTNSSQNVILLKSKTIIMTNIIFSFNSIFDYSILQPYILWGYKDDHEIYLENIIEIFPIKVQTGNAKLAGQNIQITNISVSNSVGSAFHISLENQAICLIKNAQFSNIESLFFEKNENGGIIQFDTTRIVEANITIETVRLNYIYCRSKGGFIYLHNGQSKLQLLISDILMQDVYALHGSILYCEFTVQSNTSKIISLTNLQIMNTHIGQLRFLNHFNNLEASEELKQLSYQRYLIYVDNVQTIKLQNILIKNLNYESFLQISNFAQLIITKLIITDSLFLNIGMQVDNQNSISSIYLNNIQLKNISILEIFPEKTDCVIQQINRIPYQSFQCLNESFVRISPKSLQQFYDQDLIDFCILQKMKMQMGNQIISFIDIIPYKSNITIQELIFQDINCEVCDNGLLNIKLSDSQSYLDIKQLNIQRNKCGKSSCVNIIKNQQNLRRLQSIIQYVNSKNYQLILLNFICYQNYGYEGTCLRMQDVTTLIISSIFKNNTAINKGGAIFVKGKEDFYLEQSIIQSNLAKIGGGLFMADQMNQNMTILGSLVSHNEAQLYGDDAAQIPCQLFISVDMKNYLPKIKILQTNDLMIEQIQIKKYEVMKNVITDVIYFPNGQKISEYKYFDWQKAEYKPYNLHLRLVAVDQYGSIIKDLDNSQCSIKSRLLDDELERQFATNFTNLEKVQFDKQDYNLDKLIIYLDDELNMTLQLQFNCSSILIPQIGQQKQITSYHQNYYLRMNVKTLPCQLGEIKKISNKTCIPCDPDLGQYSLVINAQRCQIKDDISIQEIKLAQLNLRAGYWRPYFHTNSISQCINLLENCMGGWKQGDNSCSIGHIGALCEECDIYDFRGYGHFSISVKYSCSSCMNTSKNIIIILIVSIWTLISIFISVKSTVALLNQIGIQIQMAKLRIIKHSKQSQSAILIKMLTNHLQILTSITTFKINFQTGISNALNSIANPIQTMTYSLDCFLIYMFSVEIHYARMIWQILMPFVYILIFLGVYFIIVKFGIIQYRLSVITTTFIYIYIYIQPNLVGGLISLISFRSISGYQWIQANVAYRYDTSYHFIWLMTFCLPGLFLFAFLIPFLFYLALYINRQGLNKLRIRQQFGYLYNEYKTDAFFWEIVKIVEKDLLIIFLAYYDDIIIKKGTLVLLVIFVYSELNRRFKPYKLLNLNNLDILSAKVCKISIILGFGIYIDELYGSLDIQIPYFIILAIINLFYFFLLLNEILKSYWIELEVQFDKVRDKIRQIVPWIMKHSFFRKHLENSVQRRNRIQTRYQKIKKYLFSYAKPIIELKYNINSISNQIKPSISNPQLLLNQDQVKKFPSIFEYLNDNLQSRTSIVISSF
ncbi:unnamed protein product [Paramecium primaurelia]|uniref:EGF-like domain-containing protein n=1 Tax=Paramecium primaurelia TaxID=5886 RepID=A0A8S1NQD0_PARPR|nr:unnamed protein product [Paramecium primaurelia]